MIAAVVSAHGAARLGVSVVETVHLPGRYLLATAAACSASTPRPHHLLTIVSSIVRTSN